MTKSTEPDISEIMRAVPRLSRTALRQLRKAVNDALATSDDVGDRALEQQVLDAICAAIKPHCFCSPAILRGNGSYASFRVKLFDEALAEADGGRTIEGWLWQSGLDRRARQAVLHYGFTMLLDELRSRGMVVDGVLLMNQTHRLPACVDRAFPGYAANGMLGMLFRNRSYGHG
jgi:hypothetical protein